MITKDDIEKLAKLARIEIPDPEKESLRKEIDAILEYVAQIKEASGLGSVEVGLPAQGESPTSSNQEKSTVRNVFRADENPHESGINTETLLTEAPEREGQYIKVKKIL